MGNYASLQLLLDDRVEAARERIIYIITAHMDMMGFIPCGRESAERTVAFVRTDGGWAVFDDCADRLDIRALDGFGCCLTGKLRTRAVGVMGSGDGHMLRLYHDGRLCDTYISSPQAFRFASGRLRSRGRAMRWRALLHGGGDIRALSGAFERAQKEPSAGFEELCRLLALGKTATFGYASLDDARLEGVVTLFFCAANRIKQRWFDHLLRPARCTGAIVGALFRRRCRQRR